MKTTVTKTTLLVLLILVLNLGLAHSDPTAGLYKITIEEGWNLVCLPLQNIQLSQGSITSISGVTITDSTKSWTENDYANDILMITNGDYEGYWYKISSNTADTLTLTEAPNSGITTSTTFHIYQANTIEEIFGGATDGLNAGSTKTEADEIYLWDANNQEFDTSIWLSNDGWMQGDTLLTDNSVTLLPNEACYVVHKAEDEVTINFVGIVPSTKQAVAVSSGENLIGRSYPTAITVEDCGLDSVLASGSSSYTADVIYRWDNTNAKYDLPIWYSSYSGYIGWYQGDVEVSAENFNACEGLYINNRDEATMWQMEKPYTSP